jgi:hypothetical protein
MDNIKAEDKKSKYWDGNKNKAIRYYFYMQKGLALLNEFRYLLMAIFMFYHFLKIDNILIIPIMFVVCVPCLAFLGHMAVHQMDKVMEYLNIEYATHFSRHNIDLQEKQLKVLKGIEDKMMQEDTIIKKDFFDNKIKCIPDQCQLNSNPPKKVCEICGTTWSVGDEPPTCQIITPSQ